MNATKCQSCGATLKPGAKFCSSCGHETRTLPERAAKAESTPSLSKSVKPPMSRKAKLVYTAVIVGVFGIFTTVFIRHLPGGDHPVIALQPEVAMPSANMGENLAAKPIDVTVAGGKISFSLTTLLQHKMVSFEYVTSSATIPLLAFIAPTGKLITAIRMCEPCNSKTFLIEGTELACGNCETRWKLGNLEGLQGSCQKYPPDPVPSTVEGNRVVIDESVVKKWKMRI